MEADPRQPTQPVRPRPETVLVPFPPAPPRYGLPGGPPTPPPPPRRRGVLWAVLAAVVVVALAVTGVVVLTSRNAAPGPVPAAAPPRVGPGDPPIATAARTALDDQVRADAAKIEPLLDKWVPQLYGESAGTDPAAQEVMRRYRAAVAARPTALLLLSTDYSSFESDGFYVVVLPMPYATAAEAIAWCTGQDLAATECYAKRISRTAGPAGSTVYQ